MSVALLALSLINPFQGGPSPSAHPTETGWNVGGAGLVLVDAEKALPGFQAVAAVAPHPRLWTSLELDQGAGWKLCMDCEALATNWTARFLAIQHESVSVAAWSQLIFVNGVFEWMPGAALEGGWQRLRFDLSSPVWSTYDLLTTLRAAPEIGASWRWNEAQVTRFSVVGLEPALALTHRVRWQAFEFEGQARYGEEGASLQLGARFFIDAF